MDADGALYFCRTPQGHGSWPNNIWDDKATRPAHWEFWCQVRLVVWISGRWQVNGCKRFRHRLILGQSQRFYHSVEYSPCIVSRASNRSDWPERGVFCRPLWNCLQRADIVYQRPAAFRQQETKCHERISGLCSQKEKIVWGHDSKDGQGRILNICFQG